MAVSSACDAEVMETTGDIHGRIRETLSSVAELVFDDAADLNPGDGMLDTNADPSKFAVVALLTRPQLLLFRLFFGCRCSRT